MAKGRPTTFVATGLTGKFTRDTDRAALFAPDGGMQEFWAPLAAIGRVEYADGQWQESGAMRLHWPVKELHLADWLAREQGLA